MSIDIRRVESQPVAQDPGQDAFTQPVRLRCSVTDTGIGMTEEVKARLFQRFEQADTTTTRKHGGTGLGLSICKQLVELMGGWIDVQTTLGKGSTFFFEIDLAQGEALPEPSVETLPSHDVALKILVAEDGVTNQIVIESILQDMGHEVTLVENGEEALDALLKQSFDVVLMDGRMPEMNGLDATRAIRNGSWRGMSLPRPDISVIALTANASLADRDEFLMAGADGFLGKPIDEAELHEVLLEVIRRKQAPPLA